MRVASWVVSASLLAVASTGCGGSENLSSDFGRSYRAIFIAQPVNKGPAVVATAGLDSQEAGVVAAGYRRKLGPGDVARDQPQLLLLTPPGEEQRAMPPPSVPKE